MFSVSNIDPYVWFGICICAVVFAFVLTHKCQVAHDEHHEGNDEKSQYAKNLTNDNKLSLNADSIEKDNANKKDKENTDSKRRDEKTNI